MKYLTLDGPKDEKLKKLIFEHHARGVRLNETATAIRSMGYISSPQGMCEVTASHVSNYKKREYGLRFVAPYEKDNYKGLNHVTVNKLKNSGNWDNFVQERDRENISKLKSVVGTLGNFKSSESISAFTTTPTAKVNVLNIVVAILHDTRNRPDRKGVHDFAENCLDQYNTAGSLTVKQINGLLNCYERCLKK